MNAVRRSGLRELASMAFGVALAHGQLGRADAAQVQPGGALELTVTGFMGMNAHGGALDNQREDPELSNGLDFSTDTEVHVLARARDERTGLDYGATVELEADTSVDTNGADTWIFLRSGWGELRFGDVEGPVEESALGADTIAAGTGGIDGDIVDELAVDAVLPSISDTATKIRYYTPSIAGFQLGIAYTPHAEDTGDTLATTDTELRHWVEGAVAYDGEIAGIGLLASLVGSVGEAHGEELAGQHLWTWYAGGAAELDLFDLGAGFGEEDVGGQEKRYVNAGIGTALDAVNLSLTYGKVLATDNYPGVGAPWNLVLSADRDLVPGLVLAADLAYFDNDLNRDAREPVGGDRGFVWITRLELSF